MDTNDRVKMIWDENRKLTWKDFQGPPEPGTGFVASTNSGISFSYSYKTRGSQIDYNFKVQSFFYPETSWYIPKDVSDYILAHEQAHFDISEIFARVLRARIESATFSENIKTEIEAIYQQTETERREMQEQFDKDSDHSKNKQGEAVWEKFIAEKLIELEAWK